MKNCILTGDLHLTTKPRDEYRWEMFLWLAEECKKRKVKRVLVLGDLTDAKDYHPSVLVNQVVSAVTGLINFADLDELVILRGNHDGIDPEWPYFRFLNELPRVKFIHTITRLSRDGGKELWLPHSRDPDKDWARLALNEYEAVLAHVTVAGAQSESGQELEGVSSAMFKRAHKVWAGDVHVPQVRGKVEYLGAPYHIRFGDKFAPRMVWLDAKGAAHDLHFDSPRRHMLDIESPSKLPSKGLAGDQAKVRVHLERSEYGKWREYKGEVVKWAEDMRVDLVAVELVPHGAPTVERRARQQEFKGPRKLFAEYCKAAKVDQRLIDTGKELL